MSMASENISDPSQQEFQTLLGVIDRIAKAESMTLSMQQEKEKTMDNSLGF